MGAGDNKVKRGGGGDGEVLGGRFRMREKAKGEWAEKEEKVGGTEAEGGEERLSGDSLHKLIALQSFEGSWELTATLCAILGIGKVEDVGIWKAEYKEKKIWATVLALVWLEEKMGGEKDTWELVAEKAWEWRRSQGGFNEGVLVGQAKQVVG